MDINEQLDEIRSRLERFALPVIKLSPRACTAKDIWSSKFGGKPYWPRGMEYPVSGSGEKLVLLAQLNFNELPTIEGYPESGILQFFIAAGDLYGMDFDNSAEEVMKSPSGYRVIFHPEIERDTALLENNLPEASGEHDLPISREYCLESRIESELPSPTDFRYESIDRDPFEYGDEVAEYIYENFISGGSKVGGYADFTQEDPRTRGEHDNWILLFQMSSEFIGESDIMWGDMGVGSFFIEKEALEKKEFSRVWYSWDCS